MASTPSIGPFDLLAELGRGGSGRVFRARHRPTGAQRALKVLDANADAESLARFEREVRVLARAGSDGVVPVHEAGRDPSGRVYYAMELMPGGSLRDRLLRQGPFGWREAAALVARLARTLDRCHALGLVHRDVKPGNILFDERGLPRLADFGCARDLAGEALTQSGTSLGTPAYMAPEQLEAKRVDPRADVFSLGVVLYELVRGTRPYVGATWSELLESVHSGTRPALTEQGTAPAELDAIVSRTLRPRPEQRTASAAELARELEELLAREPAATPGERGSLAATPSTSTAVVASARPVRRALVGLAAVAFVLPPAVLLLYQSRAQQLSPVVTLDEPVAGGHVREGEALKVSGKVRGRATRLAVNGAPVEPAADGTFEATLTLAAGSRELVVVAEGNGGARFELRRDLLVERRPEAPPWWSKLRESERPRLPLPRGVLFGERPGEYVNARDGSVLVFVPGGVFLMGSDRGDPSEAPLHEVELSPYFLGKLELTNAQFAAFVRATGYATGAESVGSNVFVGETGDFAPKRAANWHHPYGDDRLAAMDEPVVHVTWSDSLAYVLWAGLALPSEAQWERASAWDPEAHRATRYCWGEEEPGSRPVKVGNLADAALKVFSPRFPVFEGYDDGYVRLAPVGKFPDGKSPVGCEDMLGNVSEWCQDGFDPTFYAHSPRKDPVCPPGDLELRSGRGASWCAQASKVRVTARLAVPSWWTSDFRGIRVARAATDEPVPGSGPR